MILANIRMRIPPQKRGEALRILRSTAEGDKILPGCLSCRIYEDLQENNVIMFEEMWRSEEELEQRLRSNEYRRMLLVMELAGEPPEIKFQTISETGGIEVIEKARGATRNGDV